MDQWLHFAQDRWYWIAAAIIVLFIVVNIVKTVVKWILVLVIVGGLLLYGANYKDKLSVIGETVANGVKDQAVKAFSSEVKEAQYKVNADGTFTVTTKSLKLEGKAGSNDVQVTFMNHTFSIKADAAVNALIEQAKQNVKS